MTPPVIVSASRRTDIPAFFAEWVDRSLSRGVAEYRLPWSGKPAAVPLHREAVAAFVFWTRHPAPFMPVLARLERGGFPSVFHVTVTGMGRALEPRVPPLRQTLAAVRALSETIGRRRLLWRFDPILPGEDPVRLVGRFERLARALEGHSTRCTLSLAHPYRKSVRSTRGLAGLWEPADGLREAVESVARAGRSRGFEVVSCCSALLREWGIPGAACIDGALLKALYPGASIPDLPGPVREGCLCAASRDIGSYRTCGHGCLYCYAA